MKVYKFPNVYELYRQQSALDDYIKNNKMFPKEMKQKYIENKIKKRKLFTKQDMMEQGKFATNLAIASGYTYKITVSDPNNPTKGGTHFFNKYAEGVDILAKKGIAAFPPGTIQGKNDKYNLKDRKIIPDNIGYFINKAGRPFEYTTKSKKDNTPKTRTYAIFPTTKDEEFIKKYYTNQKIKNSAIFGDLYNETK